MGGFDHGFSASRGLQFDQIAPCSASILVNVCRSIPTTGKANNQQCKHVQCQQKKERSMPCTGDRPVSAQRVGDAATMGKFFIGESEIAALYRHNPLKPKTSLKPLTTR
ncbi:hypothetical protein BaRGS_00009007 [Batillaria attramentaria]|uniref:Uncharacterized protein n=1 Tax=Batillaria attramentaria TaxID=370345 RepID=A0ABD0LKD6_9CAEN